MKKPRYTNEFMQFWMAYPQVKRVVNGQVVWKRIGKNNAFVAWQYMDAEDKAHIMYAVQFEKRGDYGLEAANWLVQRRFDDVDMPEEEGEHLPASMTNVIKIVPDERINTNNERNRQIKKLKGGGSL